MLIGISLFLFACTSAPMPTPTPTIPPKPELEAARIDVTCRVVPAMAGGSMAITRSETDPRCPERVSLTYSSMFVIQVEPIGIGQAYYTLTSDTGDLIAEHNHQESIEMLNLVDENPILNVSDGSGWQFSREFWGGGYGYFEVGAVGEAGTTTLTVTVTGEVLDYVYANGEWIQQFSTGTFVSEPITITSLARN